MNDPLWKGRFIRRTIVVTKNYFKFDSHLETLLEAAVSVAIRVFRFAIIVAADGFRFVDWTLTFVFLDVSINGRTDRLAGNFWALRVRTPSCVFERIPDDDIALFCDVEATGRIEFVTTDLANSRSAYFFFKARTDAGKFLLCCCCCCFCFVMMLFDADFRTAPGAIGVVGCDFFAEIDAFLSLPLSLVASSSLELPTSGKLTRLKWSSSGGRRLVPEMGRKFTFTKMFYFSCSYSEDLSNNSQITEQLDWQTFST